MGALNQKQSTVQNRRRLRLAQFMQSIHLSCSVQAIHLSQHDYLTLKASLFKFLAQDFSCSRVRKRWVIPSEPATGKVDRLIMIGLRKGDDQPIAISELNDRETSPMLPNHNTENDLERVSLKRSMIAIVVAIHLAIVLIGALAAQPSSVLEQALANQFLGYFQILDLGQGYRFYAPSPAPTAIVTAKLKIRDDDGRIRYKTVRIPDRTTGPRLRLQRQLALANSLWTEYERELAAPEGDHSSHILAKSYARHLGNGVAGCESVELFVHRHPDPSALENALRQGSKLTLKELDTERFSTPIESLGVFPCE